MKWRWTSHCSSASIRRKAPSLLLTVVWFSVTGHGQAEGNKLIEQHYGGGDLIMRRFSFILDTQGEFSLKRKAACFLGKFWHLYCISQDRVLTGILYIYFSLFFFSQLLKQRPRVKTYHWGKREVAFRGRTLKCTWIIIAFSRVNSKFKSQILILAAAGECMWKLLKWRNMF